MTAGSPESGGTGEHEPAGERGHGGERGRAGEHERERVGEHEPAGAAMARATRLMVEATRGPAVESIHRGAAAVCDPDGRVVARVGNARLAAFLRSATKPFQAMALFETGAIDRFGIPPEELAIVIASHDGEPFHVDLVRSLQARTGVAQGWLRCGAHAPYSAATRAAMAARGEEPSVLHNNCSGKHTGMLAAALAIGAPVESYVDPDHPVQRTNRNRLARLSGMAAGEIGVAIDGCSAPTFRMPLDRFATALARLAAAGAAGEDAARWGLPDETRGLRAAWSAMVDHPEVIAGTSGRVDTDLMRAAREAGIPLIVKAGAEGVYAMALRAPEGPLGIAIKMEDGLERGRNCASIEILSQLGALPPAMAARLRDWHRPLLRNRAGLEVGEVRPAFRLER
ncbi:MAG: asparaginase [Candidatus Eisenbacteria bacterium]